MPRTSLVPHSWSLRIAVSQRVLVKGAFAFRRQFLRKTAQTSHCGAFHPRLKYLEEYLERVSWNCSTALLASQYLVAYKPGYVSKEGGQAIRIQRPLAILKLEPYQAPIRLLQASASTNIPHEADAQRRPRLDRSFLPNTPWPTPGRRVIKKIIYTANENYELLLLI